MDTWQTAYKILEFCRKQHSDLKWDIKSVNKDATYIYGSVSSIELTLGVHKEGQFEYIICRSKISFSIVWLGTFHVWMNLEKK